MTDELTEPMPPEVTDPAPPPILAGDWTDDDAEVYEDDFEHADWGPRKAAGVPHAKEEIKPVSRLLVRTVSVGTVSGVLAQPLMLVPADPNRTKLTVSAIGSAALVSFVLGSDKSDCYSGAVFWVPNTFSTVFDLEGHTGALWAYSTDAAENVALTVTAVTS